MANRTENLGEKYIPYVPPGQTPAEATLQAYLLGIFLGMIFAAANAYLGLYVGMTVSASIPAAVISMAILRQLMKRGTILENNIVQTIASTGESLAAGVIFTIPAFFIWNAARPDISIPSLVKIGYIIILGGVLGTLGMIPLRRYLIKREHGVLPYPEGTACAEVLIAGEKGGAQAKKVLWGVLAGGTYKLALGFGVWIENLVWRLPAPQKAYFGVDAIPALLGVGYILGPRTAAVLLAGGALGSLVLVPVIAFFGAETTHAIFPSTSDLIATMTGDQIHSVYVRYIGAGAVTMGGILSLLKILPALGKSLSGALRNLGQRKSEPTAEPVRTDRDLPNWLVVSGSILVALLVWIITPATPLIAVLVIVFGFIFIMVSSRIVGIVGSSSNPVSGMTIATLLGTAVLFVNIGFIGVSGMISALMVGAVVCIAVCAAGDMSQDLKTGFLVGATPWKQQIAEFAGVLSAALIVGAVVFLLNHAYGFVQTAEHPTPLLAPQANIMAILIEGVMEAKLPWDLIFFGMFLALIVECFAVPTLAFAVGLYLPVGLSAAIMVGGLVRYFMNRYRERRSIEVAGEDHGILYSSGLIAGEALVGIGLAVVVAVGVKNMAFAEGWLGSAALFVTIPIYLVLIYSLWRAAK